MRNNFGEVIIKKDSILYRTTDNKNFMYNESKPMLFCTFHPSEYTLKEYMSFIKLKRDVSLFFMIKDIKDNNIISLLPDLVDKRNDDIKIKNKKTILYKNKIENLACFCNELKKENFDGWFTSIEDFQQIEVALINENSLYEIVKTETINENNWKNSINNYINININNCNLNNNINNSDNENYRKIMRIEKKNKKITRLRTNKYWGKKYPICSSIYPLYFNINIKYKELIENYKKYMRQICVIPDFVFGIILRNVKIKYFNRIFKDLKKIEWNCNSISF